MIEIYFPWWDYDFSRKSRNICITTKFIPWANHKRLSIK